MTSTLNSDEEKKNRNFGGCVSNGICFAYYVFIATRKLIMLKNCSNEQNKEVKKKNHSIFTLAFTDDVVIEGNAELLDSKKKKLFLKSLYV